MSIVIPPSRRRDLVEHTARVGREMPNRWRRTKYWQARIAYFRRALLASGMRNLFVEWELARFHDAVARESRRLAGEERQ